MLADYHRRVKAQFDVLEQEARTQWSKLDAIVPESSRCSTAST